MLARFLFIIRRRSHGSFGIRTACTTIDRFPLGSRAISCRAVLLTRDCSAGVAIKKISAPSPELFACLSFAAARRGTTKESYTERTSTDAILDRHALDYPEGVTRDSPEATITFQFSRRSAIGDLIAGTARKLLWPAAFFFMDRSVDRRIFALVSSMESPFINIFN